MPFKRELLDELVEDAIDARIRHARLLRDLEEAHPTVAARKRVESKTPRFENAKGLKKSSVGTSRPPNSLLGESIQFSRPPKNLNEEKFSEILENRNLRELIQFSA